MHDLETPSARHSAMSQIRDWFYARETPYAMALVRILFPLAMLVAVIPRWFHVRELYSTDGSPSPFWWNFGHTDLLPVFSPEIATGLYTAMIFLLIAGSLGWKTRLSFALLTILIPYFGLLDSLSTLTKYTVLAFHVCLLLSFSECGAVWSIDAWLRRKQHSHTPPQTAEIWPQRLLQLLIGVVYLGSVATKAQTPGYFSGDQMCYWVLTNVNFPNPLGEWLSLYPSAFVAFGYIAVLWEVLFIFLVWKDPGRPVMLALGLLFHAMTFFLLGLLVFPLLYFALYCCFLRESEARTIGRAVVAWFPQTDQSRQRVSLAKQIAAWPAFLILLVSMSVVGIAAERRMDVYQQYGPAGPLTLEPLSQQAVNEIMRNDQTLAVADQIFAMDVGTLVIGGFIANPRDQFQAGETMIMQARLVKPHSDLWLEYTLRDATGRVVQSESLLAAREEYRINFQIPLDAELASGEYELSLLANGQQAAIKRISIMNQAL